jgi:pyruvate dehydrogenase E1 component beta subunit
MAHRAMAAAEKLAGEISVELIDPRTLAPLDKDTILTSVAKTGRLLVVHEAPAVGGIGGEIVRQTVEAAFDRLKGPPIVLGGACQPMPFTQVLENACMPQEDDIVRAARKIANSSVG